MKTLTAKQLKDYSPGMYCQCGAWNGNECSCKDDWTPTEVYRLRLVVRKLRKKLREKK